MYCTLGGSPLFPKWLENRFESAANFRDGAERSESEIDKLSAICVLEPPSFIDLEKGAGDVASVHYLVQDGHHRDQPTYKLCAGALFLFKITKQ
ncbi:hypothetical protein CO705_18210 [Ralstonia pickettii]|nr:hypothetical protein CO705_18210 [Ralstonia pickettii]